MYAHVCIFIYVYVGLYVNFNINIERKFFLINWDGAPCEMVPYPDCVLYV